jgi:pilus assembly protein CpaC
MTTKPDFSSGQAPRRTRASRAACVAWLSAGLLLGQAAVAGAPDDGAPAKASATAPLPTSRQPLQMTISMAPAPASAAGAAAATAPLHGPNCTGSIRGESTVFVSVGKSTLVPVDEPVRNRTLGNPAVAQATMVSPQTLYVLGESVGTTNMIVQGRSGACQIIDVVVNVDSGGLQASLTQLMPEERGIRVSTAADNLVLAGHVSSAQAAQEAVEIATVYSSHTSADGTGTNAGTGKSGGVLNMLTVDSPQQVMLEVKVAEVDKTLINQLGSALNIQGGFGSWTGALVSSLLAGVSSGIAVNKNNKLPFQVAVDAQKTDNLVKILAEPNLVTISGQEATFLAGGEVFIPVPQSSSTGATSIVLQQEDFGVGLKFTPTVMSNGRINLRVAPEVSELSPTGVTLTATNVSGATILPLITTRRASTTVQMSDGETFAIGGLISNNISGALKALPGIGEVPVLGALFRSTSFQQDRTELVFIITPHLVRPQRTANVPLPTDSFTQPKDVDVYATGNMEGRAAAHTDGTPAAGSAPVPAPAPAAAPTNVTPAAPAPQTPVSTTEAAPPVPAAPQAPTVATPAAATQPAHAPADPPPGSSAATVVPDKHVVAQTALAAPQDLANAGSSNAALAH